MNTTVSGEAKTWHKITVDFEAPQTFSEDPSTFRDYRLDVTFTNQDTGEVVTIPGYFAADGDAANSGATSGTIWRANFNPPSEGTWTYTASFRTGTDIAATTYADAPNAGSAVGFIDGETGTVEVSVSDKSGEDFRAKGMIVQDEGTHYLQHQGDGDYFIRGGPGIPENFLANTDIDNTANGRHDYATHVGDYDAGDPTWDGGKGKAIIGAVNYLADQGLNTIYLLTNTAGGDGRDVSPWTLNAADVNKFDNGLNANEIDDFSTYDVSKLSQWEVIFDHMDNKGIYKNVLLQETENDQLLDGGTTAEDTSLSVERLVYIREMIARFGHNNGIQWNIGEENTNTNQQRADQAEYLKAVDPYDHLVVIHSFPGQIGQVYDPLLDDEAFDGASFQTTAQNIRQRVIEYRDKSDAEGDPWVLAWDEDSSGNGIIDPYSNNQDSQNEVTLRSAYWGMLTAGGTGANWYFKGSSGHSLDQNYDTFDAHASVWAWTSAATEFFNTYIPFWDMKDDDGATKNGGDFVMAKDGEYYVIYLPYGKAGDVRLDLGDHGGETFDVFWYNPRTGGALQADGTVDGGAVRQIGGAPSDGGKDWVLLVRNSALPDRPDSVPVDPGPVDPGPVDPDPVDPDPVDPDPVDIDASFILIDPETDTEIAAIANGTEVDLAELDLTSFAVAVEPGQSVGSVRFTYNGQTQVENVAPFALFGDTNGDFDGQAAIPGDVSVKAEFFSGSGASGTLLGSTELEFTFIEGTTGGPVDPDPVDPDPVDPDPVDPDPVDPDPSGDGAPVYQMQSGRVVFQAEDGIFVDADNPENAKWQLTDQFAGGKGDGVLLWTGGDFFAGSNAGQPQTAPLSYQFTVDEPGTYFISLRAIRPVTGEPGDRNNDFFVQVEDGSWKKVFFSGARETFAWGTTYDVHDKKSPATFVVTQAMIDANDGVFTLGIAARSRQAGLDEIHIQKDGFSRDGDAPTSPVIDPGDPAPPDPVNVAPVVIDDAVATDEDQAILIDVLANDSDPDGDDLTITAADQPANGTVVIENGQLLYTPDAGYFGTDQITYTVSDGNGGTGSGIVAVTIDEVPDPNVAPVAADDSATTSEDQAILIDVLANDGDANGDDLTIIAVDQPANGTVVIEGGQLRYTPDTGYFGTDQITYTVSDGNGGTGSGTVVVTVEEVPDPNAAPVAVDDSATTPEDQAILIDVLANDSDPDGDDVSILSADQPAHGSVLIQNGELLYTPDAGYSGQDQITYTVSDGQGGTAVGTVAVTIDEVVDPPVDPDPDEPAPEPGDIALRYFLADTDSNEVLAELLGDDSIPLDLVEGRNVTVFTVTADGSPVGSMRLELSGVGTRVENVTPYAVSGDRNGDFLEGAQLEAGSYALSVDVFAESGAKGDLLEEAEIAFDFVETPDGPFSIFLVDAESDEVLGDITEGATIARSAVEGRSLSVFATAEEDAGIESVKIEANDDHVRVENVEPYALFGDIGSDFMKGSGLKEDSYNFRFTGFAENGAKGAELAEFDVKLNFVEDGEATTPDTLLLG